jgi:hypothetical protein
LKTLKGLAWLGLLSGRLSLLGGVFWLIWYIGYNPDFYFGIHLPEVRFELWSIAISGIGSFIFLSFWIWTANKRWRNFYAAFKAKETALWLAFWPKLQAPIVGVLPALDRPDFRLVSWLFIGGLHLLFFLIFFFRPAGNE